MATVSDPANTTHFTTPSACCISTYSFNTSTMNGFLDCMADTDTEDRVMEHQDEHHIELAKEGSGGRSG